MFWSILEGNGVHISDVSPTSREPARVALAGTDTRPVSDRHRIRVLRTRQFDRDSPWRDWRTTGGLDSPYHSLPPGKTDYPDDRGRNCRACRGQSPVGSTRLPADSSRHSPWNDKRANRLSS